MIALVNYGTGNIRSVEKALQKLGADAKVTDDPKVVMASNGVILPGVGSFGDCMSYLKKKGLDLAISEYIKDNRPYLGICLGMQILFDKSMENGEHEGLGFLRGTVKRLPESMKVPQMGWNKIIPKHRSTIFKGLSDPIYAYFVHSYYADAQAIDFLSTTNYGIRFCSGVAKGKVIGVQFHPEKSGDQGIMMLKNFLETL